VIKGRARGDAAGLAVHLLRADTNERVQVLELRGVMADDLRGALEDMELVGSGARTKRPLYHASINSAPDERLTDAQRARAIDRLEQELGLTGQARAVVEHEKQGRTHIHIVWSRIDLDRMVAIPDSHNFRRHEIVARELEREFGHDHVQGAHIDRNGEKRPDRTPSHAEMQQAGRTGLSPKEARAQITAIWNRTDSGHAFAAALEGTGWILARGDKRDFVLIDEAGETHSLARRIEGAKAKDVRARMADLDAANLPSVEEARELARINRERVAEQNRGLAPEVAQIPDHVRADEETRRLEALRQEEAQRLEGMSADDIGWRDGEQQQREAEARSAYVAAVDAQTTRHAAEHAAEKITDASLQVMGKAARTGDKILTQLTDFADSVLHIVAGAPPPREISPAEFLMNPAARHEHRQQELAALEAKQQREAALDRMAEDRQAGRHLAADDVSRLTRNELENIKRYGDTYMNQLIDDHLRTQERGRGRERER